MLLQVTALANTSQALQGTVSTQLVELDRSKEILLALTLLENMERSLQIHLLQAAELSRGSIGTGIDSVDAQLRTIMASS